MTATLATLVLVSGRVVEVSAVVVGATVVATTDELDDELEEDEVVVDAVVVVGEDVDKEMMELGSSVPSQRDTTRA